MLVSDFPAVDRSALKGALPGTEEAPWEILLNDSRIDAVVVATPAEGADPELRAEQLRKLVQAGVPLLVAHPVLDSVLIYYELDMIRGESGGVVVPYLPGRWSPEVKRMAELVAAGEESPIGRIEQAAFDRALSRRDKPTALAQFARDVDLIRAVCGDVTRIGAMGSPDPETAYANLGIQMSGPETVVTRWSIGPADSESDGRLTLVGSRGKAVLHLPDNEPWELESRPTGTAEPERIASANWSPPAAALERLATAVESRSRDAADPDWTEAIRDMELAEAIPRSLRRGRTIEVQREEFSEAGTFKSLMTSLGCGMLLVASGLLFVIALLATIARANGWVAMADALKSWPWIVVGVMCLFLIFQLLLRIAEPPGGKRKE